MNQLYDEKANRVKPENRQESDRLTINAWNSSPTPCDAEHRERPHAQRSPVSRPRRTLDEYVGQE
jgi:hypothetical protein